MSHTKYEQNPNELTANLREFNTSKFFHLYEDSNMIDELGMHPSIVLPKPQGMQLIIQYLNNKYNANMTSLNIDLSKTMNVFHYTILKDKERKEQSIQQLIPYLNKSREKAKLSSNYREGFCLAKNGHAVSVAYVKENSKEALLILDSIGTEADEEYLKLLNQSFPIPIYYQTQPLQADNRSCYNQTLVFARDITRKDKNGFYLNNILDSFKAEETTNNLFEIKKFPPELLKVPQISKFMGFYQDANLSKVIHKQKNLKEFREGYQSSLLALNKVKLLTKDSEEVNSDSLRKISQENNNCVLIVKCMDKKNEKTEVKIFFPPPQENPLITLSNNPFTNDNWDTFDDVFNSGLLSDRGKLYPFDVDNMKSRNRELYEEIIEKLKPMYKSAPSYLREKGFKWINSAARQFYLNEFSRMGFELSSTKANEYIKEAKKIKSEKNLYTFSKEFLEDLKKQNQTNISHQEMAP